MSEKGKQTLKYSIVFILAYVIFTLLTLWLENILKMQGNIVYATFEGVPLFFVMRFVIYFVSAICVIFICIIIKRLIDSNKIACILPIMVTVIISVIPFIVLALGDVSGFIVTIYLWLTDWLVYTYSLCLVLFYTVAYTIYVSIKK